MSFQETAQPGERTGVTVVSDTLATSRSPEKAETTERKTTWVMLYQNEGKAALHWACPGKQLDFSTNHTQSFVWS